MLFVSQTNAETNPRILWFQNRYFLRLIQILPGLFLIYFGMQKMAFQIVSMPVIILMCIVYAVTVWLLPIVHIHEVAVAIILSLFQTAGNVEAWDAVTTSASFNADSWQYLGIVFLANLCFFRAVVSLCFRILDHGFTHQEKKHRKLKAPVFIAVWTLAGMLAYLPYFLAFYPGIANADSMWQIQQALGHTPYNNWLSLFHTLVIQLCLTVGRMISPSANTGLAVYSVLSMFVMALVFAFILYDLYKRQLKTGWLFLLAAFFYLCPFNAIYSVHIWKDVPFGLALLAYSVLIFHYYKRESVSIGTLILLTVSGLMVCLLRSNGIYAFIACLPFFLFASKQRWKGIMAASAITLALTAVFNGPVQKALQTEQVDAVESLSIPLQQIAYTITNEGTVSDQQREALNQYIPVDEIADHYVYDLSDEIKDLTRANKTNVYISEHQSSFLKLWSDIALANPVYFIKAWALQTRGYWYFPNARVQKYLTGIVLWNDEETGFTTEPQLSKPACDIVTGILEFFDQQIYSRFWSMSLTTWAYLILFVWVIRRHGKTWLCFLPGLFVTATLMIASPVAQDFRYAYGPFLCLPVLVLLHLNERSDHKTESQPVYVTAVSALLTVLLVVITVLLNEHPNVLQKPLTYELQIQDDQSQFTSCTGRLRQHTLIDILNKEADTGDLTFECEEINGELLLKSVNGIEVDYETTHWGIKINWGESTYDVNAIDFSNDNEAVIWLVYENENW